MLGSVHNHIQEYLDAISTGTGWISNARISGIWRKRRKRGLYDTLSHPDLVKNLNPAEWDLARVMDDIRRALDRIAKAGTAMELNTSGLQQNDPRNEPRPGNPAGDACARYPGGHRGRRARSRRVGDHYPEAMEMLREVGYEEVSFFLDRKRQSVRIEEALASLKRSKYAS